VDTVVEIFNGALTAAYVASDPFLIVNERATLDFAFTASGLGDVEWYLEFASLDPFDSATPWYRETAEEDAGGGAVAMPDVTRTFTLGALNKDAQFVRSHQFARIQIRTAASGGATVENVIVSSPNCTIPVRALV
jgi:hypothetical protein